MNTCPAAAPLIEGGIDPTPLIPLPGLIWRSCQFRSVDMRHLDYHGPEGPLSLALPESLSHAVAKRRSEFLAGRLCAGLSLRALGFAETVGRRGRAPIWPQGVQGSISHNGNRAMAVTATGFSALGVDCERMIEPDRAAELAPLIQSPAEAARRPDNWPPGRYLSILFAAKEAAYKALSDRIAGIPEFPEAVASDIEADRMRITLRGWQLPVRFAIDAGDIIALAWQA